MVFLLSVNRAGYGYQNEVREVNQEEYGFIIQ